MSMKQRASFYFLFPSPLLVGPCRFFFFLLHPQSSLPWQMAKGQIGSTSHGRRIFSEKDGQLRIQTSTLTSFLSSAFCHYSPIQTSRRCTKRERHHQLTAQRKDRKIPSLRSPRWNHRKIPSLEDLFRNRIAGTRRS